MSAKRHYTIVCDGPNCNNAIPTTESFVAKARDVVKKHRWWSLGHPDQAGALDFCTWRCVDEFNKKEA